jgi:hypothetical protein
MHNPPWSTLPQQEAGAVLAFLKGVAKLEPGASTSSTAAQARALDGLFDALASQKLTMDVDQRYSWHLGTFEELLRDPALKQLLPHLPCWLRDTRPCSVSGLGGLSGGMGGRAMQDATLLGSVFSISPVCSFMAARPGGQAAAELYFPDPRHMSRSDLDSARMSLQMMVSAVMHRLDEALACLVKGKETRAPTFDWVAALLDSNQPRTHMRINPRVCSDDGTLINVASAMLGLCAPFVHSGASKNRSISP